MVDQIGGISSSTPDLSAITGSSSSTSTASKPYADLGTIGQDTAQFSGKSHEDETEKKRPRFGELIEKAKKQFSRQSEE